MQSKMACRSNRSCIFASSAASRSSVVMWSSRFPYDRGFRQPANERSAVAYAARLSVVVVGVGGVDPAVGEIERRPVGRPAGAVGEMDAGVELGQIAVGVEPEKSAFGTWIGEIGRACADDEPAMGV